MKIKKEYKDKLFKDLGEKRFNHSMRVVDMALKLNEIYKIDEDKVYLAAFFHDCAKYNEQKYIKLLEIDNDEMSKKLIQSPTLHSYIGAKVAKKVYNIKDKDILNAINYHTTGRANMSDLEKIIFLADAIEEKRDYDGVDEIRKKSFEDLTLLCLCV